MSTNPSHTLRKLLRPHARGLIIGIVAAFLEGAASLAEPWPLKIVLDNVLKSKSAQGWLNQAILAIAGPDKYAVLNLAAAAVLIVAGAGALCAYTERYLTATVGQRVMHDLRQTLYSHIQQLSLDYHDRTRTGDLIGSLTSDIEAIQNFIASGMLGVLVNSLALLGMIAIMMSLNWRFTLVALSVAPLLFVLVFRYTRRIRAASREVRKKEGEMVSVIQEVLSSTRVVKAFAREDHEQRRLEAESLESTGIALRVRGLKVRLTPLVDILVAAGTALVLWFGGRMAIRGALSTGSLVLFIWYLGRMYKPMRELSKMTDAYSRAAIGYERISEVLATKRDVEDIPEARPASAIRGEIELDRVTFSYDSHRPILKGVSFKIQPGQVAALVGPTGAGKTTIINLIARFYDPEAGTVRIDGIDVRHFQQKSLRQQISFVLQDTLLFHGPVWYNIAYGKPEATRAEIVRAAQFANADEFIDTMPLGYDTIVGERGVTLSGGQRQRIAIARAVIRDSPILILDEAGSGLDASSEALVFDALGRLMRGRTSIVIAHRLATVRAADVIFVIKAGEIVEHGRHEELLGRVGLYAKLHDLQFPVTSTDR
ncbi:MAG TPA: ABC transporter ATP-binding protein [Candidatus Acidoferrum sp.]|nr:ABC transporter ATP-binding protein [Candidatus Acidoferrum sp.]